MENRQIPELNTSLFPRGANILAGCSGGADSICLLELLYRYQKADDHDMKLTALYVHHGLREEADGDEQFVRAFCEERGIPYRTRKADVNARVEETHETVEEAARFLRYRFFGETAAEVGAAYVAVAHQENDQAETVLFQLLRGSGLKGLSGMEQSRALCPGVKIIRPLLSVSGENIRAWLKAEGIGWREDETNAQDEVSRNRIRHHVIPALCEVRPDAVEKIVDTAAYFHEIDDYFRQAAAAWIRSYAMIGNFEAEIPAETFSKLHKILKEYIIAELLRRVGCSMKDKRRVHLDAVAVLGEKPVGKRVYLPSDAAAYRDYESIVIFYIDRNGTEQSEAPEKGAVSGGEPDPAYAFTIRVFPAGKDLNFPQKEYTKWFGYDKIKEPVVLRTRRNGDQFSTVAGSRKKLKDFLIDEKIPKKRRDGLALIAAGSEVLWIPGVRMNENYKVTESTENIMEISVKTEEGEDERQDQCHDS